MNDFRFTLISVLIFITIIGLGVLAFFALETGDSNGSRQMISQLRSQVSEKDQELQNALRRIAELESDTQSVAQNTQPAEPATPATSAPSENQTPSSGTATENKHAALIREVQSMIDRKVTLQTGSRGADVGTIQKFFNAHNNTNTAVDNDYGPGTRRLVEAYQRQNNITVTGGIGPLTLNAMLAWLQNNG
ncbi:MAG: peptidoglycan-binding protein [Candidatus Pacebacteria bacterium]|nr:peptidoglycan-binding protein [Candidatus Paceibacterota bacterium]MCD8508261.1 peptidoglycan-binding protein [Candidatus Paceibacterota bacterium]MCD8527737.1 peptidoglycan-binding protein [Candidatus Paceibacterota bacterium]MCD8563486.1 peptidoglycan-binding protein [Candidatus Paceibacterota bacterium]